MIVQRPPVDWSSYPPKSASYIFPYVVAWSPRSEKVHVFSLLDQKCIQEMPFQVGVAIDLVGLVISLDLIGVCICVRMAGF